MVAGAGLAGYQVGAALRELGFAGRVTLVGDEAHRPYHRPPLSKAFLFGDTDGARLNLRPDSFYADKSIGLLVGRTALAIDRERHTLTLDDGATLEYGHLVLALGARNRPLAVPGVDLGGVHYLRTLDDARALRGSLAGAHRLVVVGAGFIGLEVAASAAKKGIAVTVLEVAGRPMARAISATLSAVFAREHAKAGIEFRFATAVTRIVGEDGVVRGVETAAGERIPGDVVVIGIGVVPNEELAADAGLAVANGIIVDAQLVSSDPDVSAVGDCAAHANVYADGAIVRLESVQNATDQARAVAARLVGRPVPYAAVPWFWSDQGELKLQIAGLTAGHDRTVVRGDPAGTSCSVFCFRGEELLGVETVNRPADHMVGRKLLAQRAALTPAQAADEGVDLKTHLVPAVAAPEPR